MTALDSLRSLSPQQRNTVIAAYLGWTLDAFDFFILVFVLKHIAEEFHTDVPAVAVAIFLTLAMRPLGALIFGLAADRFGRRTILMVDVLLYSVFEFLTGFSTGLTMFLVLRALFGVAMGGEWGVGASLVMETIPEDSRGLVSGILQAGYPSGYLIASIVFFLLFPIIGWRGMFFVGAVPALLVLYIRRNVEESPAFLQRQAKPQRPFLTVLRENIPLFLWAVLLMTAFNFFSHGTQDLYPTFLETQRQYDSYTVGAIAIVYNIGAIVGGLTFGALSQRWGRRRTIVIAALLAIPVAPLWVWGHGPVMLAIGAFLMQLFVQGAWGIVPVHLNELSPDEVRGTFPGFAYQLGNLLASGNASIQAGLAKQWGGDYALALLIVACIVAVVVALFAGFGFEKKGVRFGGKDAGQADSVMQT
ncbi:MULTISPECIES: MFS transporter [Rhizobium]|uniref:MFS transporter n=1 Tax=Rhizobium tropici TaxID=398 RepID=A0A6P1C1R6_RHITR|nr:MULTISPECIES: MFS transporter [Rhizobium]MBB4240166.1 SHS family lactate transporter-like MFS transporter [Rhizobium tropici]MBB5591436.1 SHS family lactate transporter-like MFS transporter [Rhizobium tropici]MBB6490480.1 SHS family lactate transporter-like MFS transporter [Rhizobium tropici]NEV10132.1 MFS transporter [Rhizobium tropici]TGE99056.1 MFS transporter [Rhizobium sp. SEMIA 4088]